MIHYPSLVRRIVFLVLASAWVFLFLALGSFHADDWPSHAVWPYGPIKNLCGSAGAWVAYYAYFAIGQGIYPALFFSGICIAIYLAGNRISDLWLRVVGILVLSASFAAAIHLIHPGSRTGLPEGTGGILGIGSSGFLRAHCNNLVTSLILACCFLVGLLLAADDLVVRAPGLIGNAITTVRARTPQINFNFLPLPRLPALPGFVTRDAITGADEADEADEAEQELEEATPRKIVPGKVVKSVASKVLEPAKKKPTAPPPKDLADDLDDDEPAKPPVILKRDVPRPDALPFAKPEEKLPPPPARDADSDDDLDEPNAPAAARTAGASADLIFPAPDDDVQLDYHDDEPQAEPSPIAGNSAFADDADPAPSEEATIPPAAEQAVPPPPKPDIVVKLPAMVKPRQASPPPAPPKELGEYHLPQWDHLDEAEYGYAASQESFVREKAAELEQALKEFSIDAHVVEIDTGPVITMYELSLAPGVKVSAISALQNDIMRALKAESVRIVAPVPGKNTVGIEVPNAQKEKVRLKDLMQLAPEATSKQQIPLYLGKDASGEPLVTDLAAMPHCLIAGTTGSGKSVCINTIIMSIMYKQRPDMVKLVLFDPKIVEMAPFKEIPHLMCPVINESGKAVGVLDWACEKMDERYALLSDAGVRNIKGYNSLGRDELMERLKIEDPEEAAKIPKQMPYIIIIIDELADLMMTSGKEVESFIVRIAQKARAVGIHLILATQRPSANVVTGLIKSNMPSRIAFRVASKMDSRIVLDQNGADVLLGHGDMLFLPPGASKPMRAQGTYIDDKEIRESVKLVKGLAEQQYEPELVQIKSVGGVDGEMEKDDLFDDAVRVVLETKRGSVSLLQRRLTIGYSRASRLIEQMAQSGILGDYKGSQARECNITLDEWNAMKAQTSADADDGMSV